MTALLRHVAALLDPVAPWRALGLSFAHLAFAPRSPRRLRAAPAVNAGVFFSRSFAESAAATSFVRRLAVPAPTSS
jgi:hypothetical protein